MNYLAYNNTVFCLPFIQGDGNYCLTCGSDKSVKLWNPHRKLLLKSYSGHGYEVMDAQSSCDNSQICSGGMDKSVVLFDVASGKALRKYRGHAGDIWEDNRYDPITGSP